MTRKLFALFLSLILALFLPLSAMAATEYTLTVIPGDDMSANEAIADLCKAAGISLTTGGHSALLSILMNGESVASAALRVEEDGLYAYTEAVSGKPLYFSWEDLSAALMQAMQNSSMDEAELAKMEATISQVKGQITSTLTSGLTVKTSDDILATAKEMYKDDPAMIAYIEDITKRVVVTEGTFTDAAHDPATCKKELTLTSEDFVKICDTATFQKIVGIVVAQNLSSSATDAEKAEKTAAMVQAIKKVYTESDIKETTVTLSDGEAGKLISMTVEMSMLVHPEKDASASEEPATETAKEAKPVTVTAKGVYNRLTTAGSPEKKGLFQTSGSNEGANAGVSHKVDMDIHVNDTSVVAALDAFHHEDGSLNADLSMKKDEQALFTAKLVSQKAEDGGKTGMLALLVDQEQVTVGFDRAAVGDAKDCTLAFYMRSDAAAIVEPAASDRPLISLNLKTREVSDDVLAAIETATPETATHLIGMNETDLGAFVSDMTTRLQQTLFSLLGKLPASTMELASTLFGGM